MFSVKKTFIIYLFLLLFNNTVQSQTDYAKIIVNFYIDDQQQSIENNFHFFFILNNDTIRAEILDTAICIADLLPANYTGVKDSTLIEPIASGKILSIPEFSFDVSKIDAYFQFDKYSLHFIIDIATIKNELLIETFSLSSWEFGIDNPPFESDNCDRGYNEKQDVICYWKLSSGLIISKTYP